jgi:periplasmic protein CpxP/Spy
METLMSKLNTLSLMKTSALAALLCLGALSAQARPGPHMGGSGMAGGPPIEHLLESVDASDAQRSQIKQIMKSAREDLKPQHEALQRLRNEGQALLAAPSIDAAAVESLRQQAQIQHEAVSKRMSQALVAAANVLTPEQRAKLAERMAKRKARMAEHRQERHERDAARKP